MIIRIMMIIITIIIEQIVLLAVGVGSQLPHVEASKPFQGNNVAWAQLLIVCSRTLQPDPVHSTQRSLVS